ncbi:hypothetical protein [Bradyrhizobium sp. Tv2a-2]|uniref:hypothetical protein n=1 Tax=Bradyrhizobium sp. Tv2a-2 TaxID=113395 RepID=UPI00056716AD|nr:hypothetical protein [Bradyrhizobium sp. Tv2a-2]
MTPISLQPFIAKFVGPEGNYAVEFTPTNGLGSIKTTIGDAAMTWHVDFVGLNEGGDVILGGITTGSQAVWGDCYWFEVEADAGARSIEYWGDQVLWRKDGATCG